MEKLKNNLNKLKFLSNCNKQLLTNILKSADKELIQSLNECVLNTLNGNIKLSVDERKKLEKFKYSLRKLLQIKPFYKKKKFLVQKGGFLQILLPSAIALISTLLENIIKK